MRKFSSFDAAKPRTPRGEARQREIKTKRAIRDLSDLEDEGEYKRILAEKYGIVPGHPRYEKAIAAWRELQRGKL